MGSGKSVRLFMVYGSFGGLVTAEIMNWTGHVISAPRSNLGELLKRPESARTGLYILLGEDASILGGQMGYIGEAATESRNGGAEWKVRDTGISFGDWQGRNID